MEDFLKRALLFVNDWNFVFYGVGLLGVLLYFFRAREANRIRRYTPFPIEREEASAMLRDSLIILTILLAILATTFYIDRILLPNGSAFQEGGFAIEAPPTIPPTPPAIGVAASPTGEQTESSPPSPEPEHSPTPSATAEPAVVPEASAPPEPTLPAEPTATPEPVATLTPTPFPTWTPASTVAASPIPTRPPEPTTPPVPAANCSTPGVRITSPAHGQVVSGNVSIFGTADIDRFQFYKVEFGQGGNPASFVAIGDVVRQPVRDGFLASWSANAFSTGIWTLRLTAVDETGNFPPPCDIRVVIP